LKNEEIRAKAEVEAQSTPSSMTLQYIIHSDEAPKKTENDSKDKVENKPETSSKPSDKI
jgi:hypothetical protein